MGNFISNSNEVLNETEESLKQEEEEVDLYDIEVTNILNSRKRSKSAPQNDFKVILNLKYFDDRKTPPKPIPNKDNNDLETDSEYSNNSSSENSSNESIKELIPKKKLTIKEKNEIKKIKIEIEKYKNLDKKASDIINFQNLLKDIYKNNLINCENKISKITKEDDDDDEMFVLDLDHE